MILWSLSIGNGISIAENTGQEIPIRSRKAKAILCYLYAGPNRTVSREKLCGLLWGSSSEHSARAALRQCLRRLAADLEKHNCPVLLIGRDKISANAQVDIDLQQLLHGISDGKMNSAIPSPEEIMYGYDDLDSQFTAWLRVMREGWINRISQAITTALGDSKLNGNQKIILAQAQFESEQTHESAAKLLIDNALSNGNMGVALKTYEALWNALDEQWGEEPSAELQAQIVAAKQNGYEPTRNIAKPAILPPMIVIQPFEQLGPWTQPPYFVEGFRRELIVALVRFREWIIVDGSLPPTPGGDYAITGGYREYDEQIELSITMLDQNTNRYIISESVKIDLENWGDSLQKIIRKTAISLNIHLSQTRLGALADNSGPDTSAYDLWLRAKEVCNVWRRETFDEAENLLKQVIEKAPDYAAAFSTLAGILSTRHLSEPGISRTRERAEQAKILAVKSVALDPLDGRNQHALAWAYAMQGSYARAEFHFELSLELNSNSPLTLVPCAHGFSFLGDHKRALQLTKTALDIYPSLPPSHWGYVMCIHYLAGNYKASAEAGELAGDAVLDFVAWHAAALAMAGNDKAANRRMEQFTQFAKERWMGGGDFQTKDIGVWLIHAFPIRRKKDVDALRRGFELAGLPVPLNSDAI